MFYPKVIIMKSLITCLFILAILPQCFAQTSSPSYKFSLGVSYIASFQQFVFIPEVSAFDFSWKYTPQYALEGEYRIGKHIGIPVSLSHFSYSNEYIITDFDLNPRPVEERRSLENASVTFVQLGLRYYTHLLGERSGFFFGVSSEHLVSMSSLLVRPYDPSFNPEEQEGYRGDLNGFFPFRNLAFEVGGQHRLTERLSVDVSASGTVVLLPYASHRRRAGLKTRLMYHF